MRPSPSVAAVVLTAFVAGCAAKQTRARAPEVPVVGREVTVAPREGSKVTGELLLVGRDQLWVRERDGVREVPLGTVREVRVKRHGFDFQKALTWVLAGGVLTGGVLSGACASVEGNTNCERVGLVTLGAWLVVGVPAALAAESSSRLLLKAPAPDELRPFARLPQGLPDGVTPAALATPPAGPE